MSIIRSPASTLAGLFCACSRKCMLYMPENSGENGRKAENSGERRRMLIKSLLSPQNNAVLLQCIFNTDNYGTSIFRNSIRSNEWTIE